jgi:hypothetical protein
VQKLLKILRKLCGRMLKRRLSTENPKNASLVGVVSTTLVFNIPVCNQTTLLRHPELEIAERPSAK